MARLRRVMAAVSKDGGRAPQDEDSHTPAYTFARKSLGARPVALAKVRLK